MDWDTGPPDPPQRGFDLDQWSCADLDCDRQKYVLKAEYDELSAKYEQLQLRIRELTCDAPQSQITDRVPSGLIQRCPTAEGSPPSVVNNNWDARGGHFTEVGGNVTVHYHFLTISNGNMTIAILVTFLH